MYRSYLCAAVALLAAAVCVGSTTASASARAGVPLPPTVVGQQLAWVIDQVNGGSNSLSVAEADQHLAASLRLTFPASRFVQVARQATSAYAPIRFARFAASPSKTSAIALVTTQHSGTLAVYLSVDPRAPHRIRALDVSPRPPAGPATMTSVGRYTGLFAVGGSRRMYLSCAGSGPKTVILEAGADNGADSWFAVQPWLATTTRVCSYDRANVPGGRSTPAQKPQTAADVVSDLHRLLHAAGVPGPYVLVGHSNGGLFARLYATTYPEQVGGLVLIDTGNYPAMLDRVYKRLMSPSQWRRYQAALRHRAAFVATAAAEQVDLATSYDQLAAAQRRRPLRGLPLVVISHGIPDPPMGAELVPGTDAAVEHEWQRMQVRLASLVPGGVRIVATRSDHHIPTNQPGLVVAAIRGVLAKVDAR